MPAPRFDDAVVLITGATGGVGLAAASAFAAAGARVVGTGRDQGRLMALAPRVDLALTLDVTDDASVAMATAAVLDRFGRVDVVVNNAGIGAASDWEDADLRAVQRVMDVNFYGAVRVSRSLLPAMVRAGGGVLVNVAGVAGHRGFRRQSALGASKHALVGWSRSLREDLAGTGVAVVVISPPELDPTVLGRGGSDEGRRPARRTVDSVAARILHASARHTPMARPTARTRLLSRLEDVAPSLMDRVAAFTRH